MGELIGLVVVIGIFGTPVIAVLASHFRQMAEIKSRDPKNSPTVLLELDQIKEQMAALRDTTTRYDMSFDTALQRLESRMTNIEERLMNAEHSQASVGNRI
jgi:hypothetical protein